MPHGIRLWDKSFRLTKHKGWEWCGFRTLFDLSGKLYRRCVRKPIKLKVRSAGKHSKVSAQASLQFVRERWLRTANDIIELQSKPMDFSDLITFVDLEATIVTNPVFDRIYDSVKPVTGQRSCSGKTALKEPENFSFLTQINGCECSPSETGLPDASEPSARGYREPSRQSREVRVPGINPISSGKKRRCLYCNSNHALEDCLPLQWKPCQEIIQFLASNKLYFGCLSNQHISRLCP